MAPTASDIQSFEITSSDGQVVEAAPLINDLGDETPDDKLSIRKLR